MSPSGPGRSTRRGRGEPHSLAQALEAVRSDVAPLTLLASVQEAWPEIAGAVVSAQAEPVTERDGVVTIACRSATWAQELDLMQVELLERLRERLAQGDFAQALKGLRFDAAAARHDPV